eukprot:3294887-Pyramimonas_sp.AAC.1
MATITGWVVGNTIVSMVAAEFMRVRCVFCNTSFAMTRRSSARFLSFDVQFLSECWPRRRRPPRRRRRGSSGAPSSAAAASAEPRPSAGASRRASFARGPLGSFGLPPLPDPAEDLGRRQAARWVPAIVAIRGCSR